MFNLSPTAFYAAGFLAPFLLFYQVVKHFWRGSSAKGWRQRIRGLKKPRPNIKYTKGG